MQERLVGVLILKQPILKALLKVILFISLKSSDLSNKKDDPNSSIKVGSSKSQV